jgi:glycosyltransferase involved in cell wall biosynthesis
MRILAWLSKARALQSCRAEIFDSKENEGRLRKWFPFWRGRMRTIYHSGLVGAPPTPVVRSPALVIGNLGHIGERKGQPDLFKAFGLLLELHPNIQLILQGDDGDDHAAADEIRREIAQRGWQQRVFMPGGSPDTRAFWECIDIYVQPSHYEGLPMALTEAMWHGKPCVATSVSGIPEIIRHGENGLLCSPGRPRELAEAIDQLLRNPALRSQLAQAAQKSIVAKGFTREAMSRAYAALYDEVLTC